MRLSTLIVRLRRNRQAATEQIREDARAPRQIMSLEVMSRAAQSRSLRRGMHPR